MKPTGTTKARKHDNTRSQNLSTHTIWQNSDVEIHQQTGSELCDAHVAQNLGVMHWRELFD
jgi:hypothetical protein